MEIPTSAKLEKTCQLFQVDMTLLHMREVRDTVPLTKLNTEDSFTHIVFYFPTKENLEFYFRLQVTGKPKSYIRDLGYENTTVTATRKSKIKRFNEQNNGFACALKNNTFLCRLLQESTRQLREITKFR